MKVILNGPPHNLSIAVLSIDDLYLPHSGLVAVAAAHPENRLLAGRGLPGTHDIALGSDLLKQLSAINDDNNEGAARHEIRPPFFDKSLFDGEGDRVESMEVVRAPLDIVLFEGWFVGFCPITDGEINKRYEEPIPDLEGILDVKTFRREDIVQINDLLWDYVNWWSYFDVFIQVKSNNIFKSLFLDLTFFVS